MSGTTSDVGRLLVRIEATTAQLRGQLSAAQGDIDKFTKSTQQKLSGFERAFQAVGQNALRSITGIAAGVIAVNTVTQALSGMVRAADQAAQASARIGSAMGDMRAGREVFDTIARSAQRTGTSATDAVDAFLRFSIATRQMGGTRAQALQLTDTMQKLAVVSGTSGQAGGAAMMQLGQALASGRLQGDELRSILENMPTLAEGLARQLNVSVGALRQMGTEGKLTSERVFAAILRMAPEINRQFAEMPLSVQRATVSLSQAWDNLTTQLDRTLDVTGRIARATQGAADAVQRFADRLVPEGAEDALRRVREEIEAITKAERERTEASLRAPAGRNSIRGGLVGTANGVYSDEANNARMAALREQEAALARVVDAERELAAHLAANEALTASLQAAENRRQQTLTQVQAAQEALSGTNSKTQEQMAALRQIVEAGAGAFAQYGVSAQNASAMLSALESRASAAAGIIAGLNLQLAQVRAGGGVEAAVLGVRNSLAGIAGTPEGIAQIEEATRLTRELAAEQQAAALSAEQMQSRIAAARASGNRALAASLIYQQTEAQALRDGATASVARERAEIARTAALREGTAAGGARLQSVERVRSALQEEARSAEAAAQAASQGAGAQRAASEADKARAEALKVARDGTEAYNRAYATFLALVQRGSRGEAQADIAQRTRALREDIALIQRETELIGALPGHREAEMAALRVRNELIASGKNYTEDEIRGVEALVRAREMAAQTQREIEDRLRQVQQTAQEISRDVATVLFESMTNNGKGESVVDWFKALFRRIAIQALQANIILPITQQIVGAAPGLFGIGGASGGAAAGAGGVAGGGGLLGGLGQVQQLGSLFGMGGGSGGGVLGGIMGTQLWGGTNAALAAMGPGVYGPATPAMVSAAGGATIGGLLAGVGGGYMLGSTIGGFVANSPARKQNSQIGAAGGAAAGAVIGSVIPGVGTVVGGLVGGALGGAGGGLIGPGKGFSGGDVSIGVGSDGVYRIRSSGGKNWDPGGANKQVQDSLNQINDLLRAAGVSIVGYGDNTASTIGFGQSGKIGGPTEMFNATREYMRTSNETLAKVMKQAWFQSFEDLQVILPYANDNQNLRNLMDGGSIRSRDDFNRASDFITNLYDPMNKTARESTQLAENLRAVAAQFDPVINQAREYGLQTQLIEQNRGHAIEQLLKPLLDVTNKTNLYSDAVQGLWKEYEAAIKAAGDLGRSTADLYAAWDTARENMTSQWRAQFDNAMREANDQGFITQLMGLREQSNATASAFAGLGRDPIALLAAQMKQVVRALDDAQLDQVIASLAGIDDLAVSVARQQKDALELERQRTAEIEAQLALTEQITAQLNQGGSIRQWINAQRSSGGAGLSPQMALSAAQSAFGEDLTLARAGNLDALGRITGSADALMRAGGAMYGSGPQGAALREMVLSSLENLPAVKGFDEQILAALKALGGGINVEVAIETVRTIQEHLNLLPDAERAQLIQAQEVVRLVEEKLGRFLTPAERTALIQAAEVERQISQWLGRDLTSAERASILQSDSVLRQISQAMGRELTNAERTRIIQSAEILRTVEQAIGRDLTAAERSGLIAAGTVIRAVEQQLGRALTPAEQALIIQPGTVPRSITQLIGLATGNPLIPGGSVTRDVRQNVETTETIEISRSIDQAIRASLDTLNYTVREHLPFLVNLLPMQQFLYVMREMMRGQWGGVRVTTPKASGSANGRDFDTQVYAGNGAFITLTAWDIGNWGTTLTVNADGNAFAGGRVIPFAKGGLPEMTNIPTYAPMALFGEAGPEAIMPLSRGKDGKLGVAATGAGNAEVAEELRLFRRQSAMETMALRDELRGVRAEMADMVANQRRANAA